MSSPLENREIRLHRLWSMHPYAWVDRQDSDGGFLGRAQSSSSCRFGAALVPNDGSGRRSTVRGCCPPRPVILRERPARNLKQHKSLRRDRRILFRPAMGWICGRDLAHRFYRQDPSVGAKVLCIIGLRSGASLRVTVRVRGLAAPSRLRQASGSGRAGARDAAHSRAAESAQADFAISQRRIHSLLVPLLVPLRVRARRLPAPFLNEHHSPRADGAFPNANRTRI